MSEGYDLLEALGSIQPSSLDYSDWVIIGMALKQEGYTCSDWEAWSSRDAQRYKGNGAMQHKWEGFDVNASNPVKGGSIIQMARDAGWQPPMTFVGSDIAYGWDSTIKCEGRVVDTSWLEASDVAEPDVWNPVKQITEYLEALFEANENVGYVTEAWQKDERWLPKNAGYCDRTAGQLIEELNRKGDIETVFGTPNETAGAWIRFNPLDGQGVKNTNVAEFRYALVESDAMEIGKQRAIIEELELPVAVLVHSGNKSLHAIVRVDAKDYDEYRKRVNYLYEVCQKNGLVVDTQNKNPSRLSRMPGFIRGENKQYIVATNIGKGSWTEWSEWIEAVNDDLPEPESMAGVWDALPALSPPLIDGILRQGHKMLLAGPSKAGKSYALIELCIAIAEGRNWFGWPCTKGRVLYVNLELDRASCLHRYKDVYTALGWPPESLANIDIWNLRGKAVPMDKLAPKLIRRAAKKGYIAIVIDPIYKVITGDENSADQMANFCNQFDKVCTELGCAVIYCHHHSKGSQGGKRSMDRASGSGVFARDPDALLDLIELDLTDDVIKQQENMAVCAACEAYMAACGPDGWEDVISDDDRLMSDHFMEGARALLNTSAARAGLPEAVFEARKTAGWRSGWRIEGTLREYPRFAPVNLWFDYPVHTVDTSGILGDLESDGEGNSWSGKGGKNRQKKTAAERKEERKEALESAFEACNFDGDFSIKSMAEYMGVTEKTARSRVKEHDGFWIDEGKIGRKNEGK